jgi:hypothetical protein
MALNISHRPHFQSCLFLILAAQFFIEHPATWGERFSHGSLPDSQTKNTPSCHQVFLPQNVNGMSGPFTFNLWMLDGCGIQNQVRITLTYSSFLFAISPNTGITPGPNFSLEKSLQLKDSGYTDLSLTISRVGSATPDTLLASFTTATAIGFQLNSSGRGTLEWTEFQVDEDNDISAQISPVLITRTSIPSKPVLRLPDPITSTSIQANWFPNPVSEGVLTYRTSIHGPTSEVATETVPATQTTVLFSGLEFGTPYTLRLSATNGHGEGIADTLEFTTRYNPTGSQQEILLEQIWHEWDPLGWENGSLQSAVPSPADLNLDGLVNAEDTLEILRNHGQQQKKGSPGEVTDSLH